MNLRALAAFAAVTLCASASGAEATTYKFAVLGDMGNTVNATAVAKLVATNLGPSDIVMLVGDDCYNSAPSFATQVGSRYGVFRQSGRLYSALGNHEVSDACGGGSYAKNYFSYFARPGNGRYYTFRDGPVQFFVANSEEVTDGNGKTSKQAAWMRAQIAASTAPWKICVFHRSAYSSGSEHGSTTYMQWGWENWGIDGCFAGHDHDYERVVVNPAAKGGQGVSFWTCGLGGDDYRPFRSTPVAGSRARYTGGYGACFVTADAKTLKVEFKTTAGKIMDTMILTK
ncbi:metallophosphoesterase [Sphingomonas sp.]|uniref:metallophosphoesterase n=1 Tax=Sphingomonas sp. TaxID=28214 RepID=UPI0025F508FD|nr:metallophosphoesterase [Sphingomonas sp.]MBV9528751.1 metallophosphoesterase [Sphingomonas sp.]